MSKMVRLNFSDELHRSLMIHAAIHNERAKNLVASATLNLVEAGRLPGDVPVTALTNAIRPVVTEFSDDEFQRIDDFAGRVGFSVTHLMRIAVALKYANVEFAGMQQ